MGEAEAAVTFRVDYADIDAQGRVYYGNYTRYFDRARFAFWSACGLGPDEIRRVEDETVLAQVETRYHRSAGFYEELRATARLTAAGGSSLHFAYRVTRPADGSLLAEGTAVLAYIEPASGRPRPLPTALRDRLPPVPQPPPRPSRLA
ncbi:MAG TPA: thioesterase family protein [Candidatus Methylomirabilis sp.]|jgi:YbgC/YbaW family acyl-CoA thioester hydrolase|nr:thioesterase family protein [Candidatus Methylomirabilis sp.]